MDERVLESVDIMFDEFLQDWNRSPEEIEDVLLEAYRHMVEAHQWRLQLGREEMDEAWWALRERVQQYLRECRETAGA